MARYVVDAGRSKLTVQAFAGGILSAFGHSPVIAMPDLEGEAKFDSGAPADTEIVFRVRPENLTVLDDIPANEKSEIERTTREEVLQTDRFPEICFESAKVEVDERGLGRFQFDIVGSLTLHGEKKSQRVVARVASSDGSLRISGETRVHQSAFGIEQFSAVGGTLRVKDEVRLKFDIVAEPDGEE